MKNIVLLILLLLAYTAAPVMGQSIVISMQATAGSVISSTHTFGVHNDALVGWDDYDHPQPPLPPSEYLCLAFAMDGYSGPLPNRWLDEFRPTLEMEDETEDWNVIVDTDQVGQTASLVFTAIEGANLPLAVIVTPLEGRPKRESLPAEIMLPLTEETMVLTVTLIWDDPTASAKAAWGEVKSIYGFE